MDGRRTQAVTREDTEQLLADALADRREALLRLHSYRLRRADLEECLGQAALEVLVAIRRGRRFSCERHARAALEQRFLSRIADQQRAVAGRSPLRAALERAARVDDDSTRDLPDRSADLDRRVLERERITAIARSTDGLSPAERLVIGTQLGLPLDAASVCVAAGWSREKYRKTAQRARERLRAAVGS